MSLLRVLVVDDEPEFRVALVELLATDPGIQVVGAAGGPSEAVALAGFHRPDVVVMDVKMPGGGGPQATRAIRRQLPGTKIVALSAYQDRTTVLEMISVGAAGYVIKGCPPADIIAAVHRAAEGLSVMSPAASAELIDELTSRLRAEEQGVTDRRARVERIRRALDGRFQIAYQPIVDLRSGVTAGVEALTRFAEGPDRTPDTWFADAAELGLLAELETATFKAAIEVLEQLPSGLFLSVNLSPEVAVSPGFWDPMPTEVVRRLVVELTEHAPVHDYDELRVALAPLRTAGGLVAVDDAGAGFASLRHILLLAADFIKIDASLVHGLDEDRSQRAMASALISFADQTGAVVIAEGIERQRDLEALKALGVTHGQGYLLGRPAPLEHLRFTMPAATPLG